MNRREWIAMSAVSLGAMACQGSSLTAMLDVVRHDAKDAFDHILLGAADLEEGIRWVEERTGARAKPGGSHPGRGTRNALLALGRGHYLEIIAPDPAQPKVPDERGLRKLSAPRIIQWAIHSEDIAGAKRLAEAAGVKTVGPQPGSRQRPDGTMLRWQTLGIESTTPLVPFIIQWEPGSPHPSSDAPQLGGVQRLRFETPQPDELRRVLHGTGVEADIRRAGDPRIVLAVRTARGTIEMS